MAWCCNCRTDVPLSRAVAELPCPKCGAIGYFCVLLETSLEDRLAESERLMASGAWDRALSILEAAAEAGEISAADRVLSVANLKWRQKCAAAAVELLTEGPLPVEEFKQALIPEFDQFVVEWLLQSYTGIKLVPRGGSFEVRCA